MKKLISLILCLALILSAMTLVFADEAEDAVLLITTTSLLDIAMPKAGFTDIDTNEWYAEAVNYCYDNCLMNGMTESLFGPDETVTRAMAVTVLWRFAGERVVNYLMPFADVNEEEYYAEAVRWASSEKIVQGTTETTFEPDAAITREDLATMIYNYEKYCGGGFTGMWMYFLPLEDRADISEYATEAVYWLYMKKVISGTDDNMFKPADKATRAELAQMIMQYGALDEPVEEPVAIVGGWTESKDGVISDTVRGYFDKAFEGFTGVGYKPVKLLATQVVAGRTYKFLCDATTVTYPPTTYQAEVVIFVALDGTCSITSITKL